MGPRRSFLDTNIFIYSVDPRFPVKQERALEIIDEALTRGTSLISFQVVQEFLNVSLKKFEAPPSDKHLTIYLRDVLWPLCEVLPSPQLYARSLLIRRKTGWSLYDSLMVSAALIGACDVLYTEDLQDGRVIEGLEIRNPFK